MATKKQTPEAPAKKAAAPPPDKPKTHLGNRPTKGEWDFSGESVTEMPVFSRAPSTARLPFPWEDYAAALESGAEARKVEVPLRFWTEGREFPLSECTMPKCKERLRRSLTGWKEADKDKRSIYTLSFADHYDAKAGTPDGYSGCTMWFIHKPEAKGKKKAA
jgi:hypothetical protein